MTGSPLADELIKSYEGYRTKAYQCSAKKWTIGWGHTRGVAEGMVISKETAEEYFKADKARFEQAINKQYPDLMQNQFDAMLSFYFNLGSIKKDSNLHKYLGENIMPNAMRTWYLYYNSNGKPELGLKRRRASEIIIFTGFPYTTWKEPRNMDNPALVQLLVNIQEYLGGLDDNE